MTRLSRGNYRLTVPRIGCGRVKAATTRLLRCNCRLTMPRIGCDRVKAAKGKIQADSSKDRLGPTHKRGNLATIRVTKIYKSTRGA
jgi:hypothetical protein